MLCEILTLENLVWGKSDTSFAMLKNTSIGCGRNFFEVHEEETIDVEKHFCERWALVKTDLDDAGALLNPYLLQDKELADDLDAITACKRVLERLCSPKTYRDVVLEFLAFRHQQLPFHNMLDPKQEKCSAHAWWDFEGACGKLIAPRRILAQTVSSSSCERNWSSYSFVHNKSRNRFQKQRAEDLVYVYTNSRLIPKAKAKDEKKWYNENVSSKDSDSASKDEDGDD